MRCRWLLLSLSLGLFLGGARTRESAHTIITPSLSAGRESLGYRRFSDCQTRRLHAHTDRDRYGRVRALCAVLLGSEQGDTERDPSLFSSFLSGAVLSLSLSPSLRVYCCPCRSREWLASLRPVLVGRAAASRRGSPRRRWTAIR